MLAGLCVMSAAGMEPHCTKKYGAALCVWECADVPVNSTHPDYDAALPAWQRARDVMSGEEAVGGDDAADALRYLVATKPRRVIERKLTGL